MDDTDNDALLYHFPLRSGLGAPWKAIFRKHGRMTSYRYETKDEAISQLTAAGYRLEIDHTEREA